LGREECSAQVGGRSCLRAFRRIVRASRYAKSRAGRRFMKFSGAGTQVTYFPNLLAIQGGLYLPDSKAAMDFGRIPSFPSRSTAARISDHTYNAAKKLRESADSAGRGRRWSDHLEQSMLSRGSGGRE
jgi:hypothetical protein